MDHWEGRWSFFDKATKVEERCSFSTEKCTKYSSSWFGISHKKALYNQDVLNERLVKFECEPYQKVYYYIDIDKTVIR